MNRQQHSRGSPVEVGVLDSEDVNGSLITRGAQEGRVRAEVDAEITKHELSLIDGNK